MVDWDTIKKNDHLVMVVPRKKIFGVKDEGSFQGFSKQNFMLKLVGNLGFLTRGLVGSKDEHFNNGLYAESDENYKQLIPYVLIVNKKLKKVYAFKRASDKNNAHEARLHGNWCWGVGGHVDFQEDFYDISMHEFLKNNMLREIEEEVNIREGKILTVDHIGFINDDSDSVGRVHLGILYVAFTDSSLIIPKDHESVEGNFLSLQELEVLATTKGVNCDNWSRMALDSLKEILVD